MPIAVTVREVMDPQVVTIDSDQTVAEAVQKMIETDVWSLLVERQRLPVGVITDRGILRRTLGVGHHPDKVKVEEIMSSPIITIGPEARAGEALEKMIELNVRRLYVVEEGKIIGRLTQSGLTRNLLDVMTTLMSVRTQL